MSTSSPATTIRRRSITSPKCAPSSTIEFENPPAASLDRLASDVVVVPRPAAVAVTQDRLAEKRFLLDAGTPTAPHAPVVSIDDRPDVGYPAILKTARLGYDGKGQRGLDGPDDLAAAWVELGAVPCVLERRLPLDAELSVLVARSAAGDHAAYPVTENVHVEGILDLSVVPARVDASVASRAAAIAVDLACRLDYVGVLAVEVFVSDGRVLVNELAPRPHNSGHWTLDAAPVSQFDQQVRAICGSALGPTTPTVPAAAMVNLLGDLWAEGEPNWAVALADPAARLAPLRQGGASTGSQDGPPDRRRTDRRRSRRAGARPPGSALTSPGARIWVHSVADSREELRPEGSVGGIAPRCALAQTVMPISWPMAYVTAQAPSTMNT